VLKNKEKIKEKIWKELVKYLKKHEKKFKEIPSEKLKLDEDLIENIIHLTFFVSFSVPLVWYSIL